MRGGKGNRGKVGKGEEREGKAGVDLEWRGEGTGVGECGGGEGRG